MVRRSSEPPPPAKPFKSHRGFFWRNSGPSKRSNRSSRPPSPLRPTIPPPRQPSPRWPTIPSPPPPPKEPYRPPPPYFRPSNYHQTSNSSAPPRTPPQKIYDPILPRPPYYSPTPSNAPHEAIRTPPRHYYHGVSQPLPASYVNSQKGFVNYPSPQSVFMEQPSPLSSVTDQSEPSPSVYPSKAYKNYSPFDDNLYQNGYSSTYVNQQLDFSESWETYETPKQQAIRMNDEQFLSHKRKLNKLEEDQQSLLESPELRAEITQLIELHLHRQRIASGDYRMC